VFNMRGDSHVSVLPGMLPKGVEELDREQSSIWIEKFHLYAMKPRDHDSCVNAMSAADSSLTRKFDLLHEK
jgi:hypothetical protein